MNEQYVMGPAPFINAAQILEMRGFPVHAAAVRALGTLQMQPAEKGTSEEMLDSLCKGLDERFPGAVNPASSAPFVPKYLKAIDDQLTQLRMMSETAGRLAAENDGSAVEDLTNRVNALEAERNTLTMQVETWKAAFGTPDLFVVTREHDALESSERLARAQREICVLTDAVTDGVCNLKLARRIWRDLSHCISQLPRDQPETISLYRERLAGYAPMLGHTENYRIHVVPELAKVVEERDAAEERATRAERELAELEQATTKEIESLQAIINGRIAALEARVNKEIT